MTISRLPRTQPIPASRNIASISQPKPLRFASSDHLNASEERIAQSIFTRFLEKITAALHAMADWLALQVKKLFGFHESAAHTTTWKPVVTAGSLVLYQDQQAPIGNFYKLDESFYRGAQPGITDDDRLDPDALKKGLTHLRDNCGVRTILNLRNETDLRQEFIHHPKDHQEKEQQAIDELNRQASPEQQIKYINIPIRSGSAITDSQIGPILAVLKGSAPENPVFVHCKAGIDRTGLVATLYRALKYPDVLFQDVYTEMQHCGHRSDGMWKGYVNNIAYHLRSQPIFSDYYGRNQKALDAR